jgi:hypothetical protein
MYVYMACVPECDNTPAHRPQKHTLYTTYSICISSNSDESEKLPDDGIPLAKHVGARILNK